MKIIIGGTGDSPGYYLPKNGAIRFHTQKRIGGTPTMTPTGWIVAAAAFAVAAVVFFLLGIRYRKRVAEK